MKKFVLTVAILTLGASQAFAQADILGLYADQAMNECNITIPVNIPTTMYVMHNSTSGATASQFQLSDPRTATFITTGVNLASGSYIAIGDPFTGVSVAYTACLTGTFGVYNISFLALGVALPNCTYITLGPDPVSGKTQIADCNFFEIEVTGAQAILNADGTCDCDVATQETTWGKVKSLYR